MTFRFLLRPQARFHDGSKLDAHDVAFSLNLLKTKGHPIITQLMRGVRALLPARLRERPVSVVASGLIVLARKSVQPNQPAASA